MSGKIKKSLVKKSRNFVSHSNLDFCSFECWWRNSLFLTHFPFNSVVKACQRKVKCFLNAETSRDNRQTKHKRFPIFTQFCFLLIFKEKLLCRKKLTCVSFVKCQCFVFSCIYHWGIAIRGCGKQWERSDHCFPHPRIAIALLLCKKVANLKQFSAIFRIKSWLKMIT